MKMRNPCHCRACGEPPAGLRKRIRTQTLANNTCDAFGGGGFDSSSGSRSVRRCVCAYTRLSRQNVNDTQTKRVDLMYAIPFIRFRERARASEPNERATGASDSFIRQRQHCRVGSVLYCARRRRRHCGLVVLPETIFSGPIESNHKSYGRSK